MGCHGSHNAHNVVRTEERKNNEPRFSNCNGRITRLIQVIFQFFMIERLPTCGELGAYFEKFYIAG